MNYLQWIAAAFLVGWGFLFGYMKGYLNAKTEWYYRGKNRGRAEAVKVQLDASK